MKYYAVKINGEGTIYTSWEECKRHVSGIAGAIYKSFPTQAEAEAFLNDDSKSIIEASEAELHDFSIPFAFTDGSINPQNGTYGYGGILYDGANFHILEGSRNDCMSKMNNVSGEILGSAAAISKAIELGLPKLRLFYDYTGITLWPNGSWKIKDYNTTQDPKDQWLAQYVGFVHECQKRIQIEFRHTKGHTGIIGNELVDRLAKRAVGLGNEKIERDIERLSLELQSL